jgi:hypothetical protein
MVLKEPEKETERLDSFWKATESSSGKKKTVDSRGCCYITVDPETLAPGNAETVCTLLNKRAIQLSCSQWLYGKRLQF